MYGDLFASMKQPSATVPVVIPAYRPGAPLLDIIRTLLERSEQPIIIVDDGSGPEFAALFEEAGGSDRVHVLHHAVNLGKGAALKTGMNCALLRFPECCGVVTADADGQHRPEDILRIEDRLQSEPEALILGVRTFSGHVPFRSRLGNGLTRFLVRLMLGQNLADTQSGLRGVPVALMRHLLQVHSTGYEFELDMLMACKHQNIRVVQEPIQTVYLDGNRSSHFHPLFDSARIYFLLFRFSVLSLLTAVVDNVVFVIALAATASIAQSQALGRLVAMTFNYLGARHLVFHSQQRQAIVLPKYVLLVACNGLVSYTLIQFLHSRFGVRTIAAKIGAEAFLFIANFAIQRDFVFTRRRADSIATDWDEYYRHVTPTARLTRRYTASRIVGAIRRYAAPDSARRELSIIEMGGANSCFLDTILARIGCRSYDVIDTNAYGLSLLEQRVGASEIVRFHEHSVLALSLERQADVVFSVGLVEHFESRETREAVLAHFKPLRAGGIAIITFPTPTLLYRATRMIAEALRVWKFPDERPLNPEEVRASVRECGDVLYDGILWPLVLTQHLIVARKRT